MNVLASKAFLSSTFFPNSESLVAAMKTIEIMQRDNLLDVLKAKGERFGAKVQKIVENCSIPCKLSGAPWMPFITFEADPDKKYKIIRPEFYTQLIRRGIFLQPFHHGYVAVRHTEADLDFVADSIAEVLDDLKKI
jgi:glutamate-1-semialdehyde aminotransferase